MKMWSTILWSLITALLALVLSAAPSLAQQRPNILLLLADDLDTASATHLPRLQSLLAAQGTTFTKAFVSLALCCPSRVSILRGQYAHNTQIFNNESGFQKVFDQGLEQSTVATWLHDAGYRTILLGKYLNDYPGDVNPSYVPPGWDEWYGILGEPNFFGYMLNENSQIIPYGDRPDEYLTDVLAAKATAFIRRAASGSQPFFMYLAPYAPHRPATPAPRHAQTFPGVTAPRPPSFNEADVSDKPTWLRSQPLLTAQQITSLDALYRKRLQSMLAVEDLLVTLIRTLRETGLLGQTYLFFTSDNGFHLGQHRLKPGKATAYEEDIRVPLIVRGPGVPAGRVRHHLAGNIDLAPTFAALAGAVAAPFVDGRSLTPMLRRSLPPGTRWREALLLERGRGTTKLQVFQGLRTTNYTYVEYRSTGERELYDLHTDPFQLHSLHETADPTLLAQLALWFERLRTCAGEDCRTTEERPP